MVCRHDWGADICNSGNVVATGIPKPQACPQRKLIKPQSAEGEVSDLQGIGQGSRDL